MLEKRNKKYLKGRAVQSVCRIVSREVIVCTQGQTGMLIYFTISLRPCLFNSASIVNRSRLGKTVCTTNGTIFVKCYNILYDSFLVYGAGHMLTNNYEFYQNAPQL